MRTCFANVLSSVAMTMIAATVCLRPAAADFVAAGCEAETLRCKTDYIGDNVVTKLCTCDVGLCPAPPPYVGEVGLGFYTPAPPCKPGAAVSYFITEVDTKTPVRDVYKQWDCTEYCDYPDGKSEGLSQDSTYYEQDITNGEDRVVPPDSGSANADATSSDGVGSSGGGGFVTAAAAAVAVIVQAAVMGAA